MLSFKCRIYQNNTARILSFQLNTSHALQRSCKHSGNSFTHWGCSNLINSGGSLQICRVVHSLTPDPPRSLCAPRPDSSVSETPAIPTSIPTLLQGLSTLWTRPSFVYCYSTLEYLLPSVLPVLISLLSAQAISHVDMLHSAGQKWSGTALLGHVGGCQIFSHRQSEMPEAVAALIRHHMLPVQPVYPLHFPRTLHSPQDFQA